MQQEAPVERSEERHTTCALAAAGEPLPMEQRRRLFGTMRQKVAGLAAWPGHIYTLHLWQHLLDVGSLQLATPLMRISLARCEKSPRESWTAQTRLTCGQPAAGLFPVLRISPARCTESASLVPDVA